MLRRALIASVLATILSACSAGPALFGPSTGTVTGNVQFRACGGANRPEQTGCPSHPYAGVTLTFALSPSAGQGSEKTVTTDNKGSFRIELAPGTYSVKASAATAAKAQSVPNSQAAAGGFGGPRQVVVTAGKTVTADFAYTIQLL
jgi:hypothetical protein